MNTVDRNKAAWKHATKSSGAVADAMMMNDEVIRAVATWPGRHATFLWRLLALRRGIAEVREIMCTRGFRATDVREAMEIWRALEAKAAENADAIVEHLAKLSATPDTIDGLSLLALVVEGMPVEVEPDGRPDSIMPEDLFAWCGDGAPNIITRRHDNDLPVTLGLVESDPQLWLPGVGAPDSKVVPAPAIILTEAVGFRDLVPGKGARLDKRIFAFSLLRLPRSARRPGGCYTWRPKLRELVHDLVFPAPARTGTGKSTRSLWKPSRHAPTLARALDAVSLAGVKLPDGGEWRPVLVRRMPDFGDMESRVEIDMKLPDESDHGPLVRWDPLIAAGMVSDPAFDGALTLAALWDRAKANNGGWRIYATRPRARRDDKGRLTDAAGTVITGPDPDAPWKERRRVPTDRPARDWSDSRAEIVGEERHPAANRVPVLDRDERRRLFFGHGSDRLTTSGRSMAANRADARLRTLEVQGHVVIEVEPRGWRILERRPNLPDGARA